jgi:hypothetical protein
VAGTLRSGVNDEHHGARHRTGGVGQRNFSGVLTVVSGQ